MHLFGSLDTFPDYVAGLRRGGPGPPGAASRAASTGSVLAEVYGRIDVLVVPSLWPENSPLVIHEAFMAGLPVVGAGWAGSQTWSATASTACSTKPSLPTVWPPRSGGSWTTQSCPERLAAAHPPVKTMAEDAAEWEAVYGEVVGRHARGGREAGFP